MNYSLASHRFLERKMENETHTDLFDRIVMAVRTKRIQSSVSELRNSPIHDWQQLDIQPTQTPLLEVVVDRVWHGRIRRGLVAIQSVVASSKSNRTLNIRL